MSFYFVRYVVRSLFVFVLYVRFRDLCIPLFIYSVISVCVYFLCSYVFLSYFMD